MYRQKINLQYFEWQCQLYMNIMRAYKKVLIIYTWINVIIMFLLVQGFGLCSNKVKKKVKKPLSIYKKNEIRYVWSSVEGKGGH